MSMVIGQYLELLALLQLIMRTTLGWETAHFNS
uniref:Uncharacterized protein n=1 Tax=Anguilla anguilla TaxID=7936 RepID=A0A0E9S1X1_ANGAN